MNEGLVGHILFNSLTSTILFYFVSCHEDSFEASMRVICLHFLRLNFRIHHYDNHLLT